MSEKSPRSGPGRPALPPEEKAKSTHVKIPPADLEQIELAAKAEGLNKSQLILKAVRAYLGIKKAP